eukprot:4742899-Pyramimonas_sp.AAC.2
MSLGEASRSNEACMRMVYTLPGQHACREARKHGVDVKGNGVDVKGNGVDVKGNGVDVKGNNVDVKGNGVDVKGNGMDVKGNGVDVKNKGAPRGSRGPWEGGVVHPSPLGDALRVPSELVLPEDVVCEHSGARPNTHGGSVGHSDG